MRPPKSPAGAAASPRPRKCRKCGQVHERCSGHVKRSDPPRPCMRWPRKGERACRQCGGNAPAAKAAGVRARAEAAAVEAVARLGVSRQIPPQQALLEEVWRTAGRVAWLEAKVGDLGEAGFFVSTMFGPTPNAWEGQLRVERQHLARVSVDAIRGGAIETQVEIAKDIGQRVGVWLDAIVRDLGLDEEQRAAAWASGERNLRLVAGGHTSDVAVAAG